MMKLNNSIKIKVDRAGQNTIQQFVEDVSDKLMINNTYFGNLISAINALYCLMVDYQPDTSLAISYTTDYQSLTFVFQNVSRETSLMFENISNENSGVNNSLLIIKNLTENIIVNENEISLVFDIGAVNQIVYDKRKILLNEYLTGMLLKKSITPHDQF